MSKKANRLERNREIKNGSWLDCVPNEWKSNSDWPSIRFELFSSSQMVVAETQFARRVADAAVRLIAHPVDAVFLSLHQPIEAQQAKLFFSYNLLDKAINAFGWMLTIPAGEYALIMSPNQRSEEGVRESDAKDSILSLRGFLCTILGPTITHSHIWEFSVPVDRAAQINSFSNEISTATFPQDFVFCDPVSIDKVAIACCADGNESTRRIIELSFLFLGRAQKSNDSTLRFFDIWTALEVFWGGYSKLSGFIDKGHSRKKWRSKMLALKEKRRLVVHEGKRLSINQDEERLLLATLIEGILSKFGIHDELIEEYIMTLP